MPATKPAKILQNQEYESVNSLFNIPVGHEITIQNQGDAPYKLSLSNSKPAFDTLAYRISPAIKGDLAYIGSGEPEVWALGNTQIHAEE